MVLIKRPFYVTTVAAVAMVLSACGKGISDSGLSGAINVSGVISAVTGSQKASVTPEDKVGALTVNLSTYTITCATINPPVQTASVALNADGTFSISVPGAINQPMACHMVDANGDNVGDFLISDGAKQDMNGNDQVSSTMALSGDADLGPIDFDPDAQEVTIPKANIAAVITDTPPAASLVFDPTGQWTIGAVDFTRPPGVKSACDPLDNTCKGPPSGQAIYMKLWKGAVIADSSDIYGLQVWDSFAGYTTCGSKIGLPSAVQTSIGVDFTANGAANADFNLTTNVNAFVDLANMNALTNINMTDYWKMDNATLQHPVQTSCGPTDITIGSVSYSKAWKCGPDLQGTPMYQISLGGGCFNTATSDPVNVTDWSLINSCGTGTSTDVNGIKSITCTGTANSVAVTCNNKWVIVNGSNVPQPAGNFQWGDLTQQTVGTLCSAMPNVSEQEKIAQLQCYAEYRYRSGMDQYSNACLPRVNTDWSAATAANFAQVDFRPEQLVFFEQYRPTPDGKGGSILSRQERFDGVQVDGNSWVNCRVVETGGLSFKRISDDKLLAIYQSSRISTSTSKPACMAEFDGRRETFMFYLNK